MMNRQAQAWGLKNTAFKNVTGLTEPGHHSSARDMAVIAAHIIRDFPEYYPYYSIKEYNYNKITQDNRNLLLRRDPTVDGMKTGYTEAAGYCLVASAQRDFPNLGQRRGGGKRRLLSVVLDTTSMEARANESQKLLNWGFQAFDAVRLFDAGKPIVDARRSGRARPTTAKLGAAGAVLRQRCRAARAPSCRPRSSAPIRWSRRSPRASASARVKVTTAAGTPVAEVPLVVHGAGRAGRHLRPRLGRAAAVDQVSESARAMEHAMQTLPDSPVLPERRVRAAARRQGLGARPRLHLRRRRLRGRAGLRPRCSASTSTWRGSTRSLAKLRIANPLTPRRSGSSAAAS